MHPIETKNQFIELRAQGLSLDAISSQLNVPRATLGRWHHESVEQIQRLRALQWHLLEEQIGHRLEESLQRVAQRIRKFEDELDRRDPGHRKTPELVRIIRDSRREYLQLRALLVAPLHPPRGRTACLAGLDPQKRDKTRQNPDSPDTTALSTNDLQKPKPTMSHSTLHETIPGGASSASPDHPALPSVATQTASPSTTEEVVTDTLVINTPLQRCEPAQPQTDPTASAVSHIEPPESVQPTQHPVGVPSSDGPSNANSTSHAKPPPDPETV